MLPSFASVDVKLLLQLVLLLFGCSSSLAKRNDSQEKACGKGLEGKQEGLRIHILKSGGKSVDSMYSINSKLLEFLKYYGLKVVLGCLI